MLKSLILASTVVVLCSCSTDTAAGPNDATQSFGALRLDQHAITLAVAPPHNTLQLHAMRLSQAGTLLPDSGTVSYQVAYGDTSVSVSPEGVVTAKVPSYEMGISSGGNFYGLSALIIASLTIQGVTRVDTAGVVVTATEPAAPLASLSIHPPPESLSVYTSGHWLIPPNAAVLNLTQLDSQGDTIPNQLVYYRSSNPSVAYPYAGGGVFGRSVVGIVVNDTVTFYAQTWYYGVARSDSLQVRVGYQSLMTLSTFERTPLNSLTSELYWWPQNIELTAPASVSFINRSPIQAVDVVFDDPEGAQVDTADENRIRRINLGYLFPLTGSGNVAPFFWDTSGFGHACEVADTATNPAVATIADSTCRWKRNNFRRFRSFPKPGTYTYHTMFGSGGKIVVH